MVFSVDSDEFNCDFFLGGIDIVACIFIGFASEPLVCFKGSCSFDVIGEIVWLPLIDTFEFGEVSDNNYTHQGGYWYLCCSVEPGCKA